jgi:hypothetical protein
MVFSSDGWLKMMPSAVAILPWPTETVKLGSVVGPELPPWVTAQTISAITRTTTTPAMP